MFRALSTHTFLCLEFFHFSLFPGSFFRPSFDNTAYGKPSRLFLLGSPSASSLITFRVDGFSPWIVNTGSGCSGPLSIQII